MGPAAHAVAAAASDNRWAVEDRLPSVLAEIRNLLDLPAGAGRRSRTAVERALTNGYACALELERDRLRAERGLRDLLGRDPDASADDVARAHRALTATERELAGLRELLSTARAHVLQ
jgi:hypothetical protein